MYHILCKTVPFTVMCFNHTDYFFRLQNPIKLSIGQQGHCHFFRYIPPHVILIITAKSPDLVKLE